MFSKEIFADRLVALRREKGVNQSVVADSVGVGRTMIGMLEGGNSAPSLDSLCALADYFNVSLDYLVGRDDVPNRKENHDEL